MKAGNDNVITSRDILHPEEILTATKLNRWNYLHELHIMPTMIRKAERRMDAATTSLMQPIIIRTTELLDPLTKLTN